MQVLPGTRPQEVQGRWGVGNVRIPAAGPDSRDRFEYEVDTSIREGRRRGYARDGL